MLIVLLTVIKLYYNLRCSLTVTDARLRELQALGKNSLLICDAQIAMTLNS